MQAIARVNRTFRDKPGGLIVDYIGVSTNLRASPGRVLAERPRPGRRADRGDGRGDAGKARHRPRRCCTAATFDSSPMLPAAERLAQHAMVLDFVMADPDRTARFLDQVLALAKAFALCGARDEAARDPQRRPTVHRRARGDPEDPEPRLRTRLAAAPSRLDTAIGQLVNEAVAADEVVDIYKLAGIDTPELSILSDEFLDSPGRQGQAEPADGSAAPTAQRPDQDGPAHQRRPGADASPSSSTRRSTATPTAR